ncbi:hypothetical protein JANLI_04350 [Janthinobacterium lividum]|nr:hypothetical protein JANLI_04350 [Janthinobacterium lividum]
MIRVLTKKPITPSVSTRLRLAIGTPMRSACWPVWRYSSALKAVSSSMKTVAPWRRALRCSCAPSSGGSAKSKRAAW